MEIAGPWKERKANETALKHVVSKPYLKNRSRACHFARLLFTHNIIHSDLPASPLLVLQKAGIGNHHSLMLQIQGIERRKKSALICSQIRRRLIKKLRNRNITGSTDFLNGLHTRIRILFKHGRKRRQRNTGTLG